jgi:transposase InsO family protein
LFSRFDSPFGLNKFKAFSKKNCIKCVHSLPYNPESNGLAERSVQTIKTLLIKNFCCRDMKRMQSKINSILASYRNTPTTSTSCSPTELINKFKPKNHLSVLKPPCVVDNNKIDIVIKYEINDKVLVSNNSKGQK